jgi:hypothetical protein
MRKDGSVDMGSGGSAIFSDNIGDGAIFSATTGSAPPQLLQLG